MKIVKNESSMAWEAWEIYRDLGAGSRTLPAVHGALVAKGYKVSLSSVHGWSASFDWQARLRAYYLGIEAERRKVEVDKQAAKAEKTAQYIYDAGQACLTLALAAIRTYINADGTLKAYVQPRDVPALVKAGAEAMLLASGMPTQRLQVWGAEDWAKALADADPERRLVLLRGLRAAREMARPERGTEKGA